MPSTTCDVPGPIFPDHLTIRDRVHSRCRWCALGQCSWIVVRRCGRMRAKVRGHPDPFVEDLHRGSRHADLDFLLGERVGTSHIAATYWLREPTELIECASLDRMRGLPEVDVERWHITTFEFLCMVPVMLVYIAVERSVSLAKWLWKPSPPGAASV
jgi:hypothetical protein